MFPCGQFVSHCVFVVVPTVLETVTVLFDFLKRNIKNNSILCWLGQFSNPPMLIKDQYLLFSIVW